MSNKQTNSGRYILLEKAGSNNQTQIYEMVLSGKSVKIRHGQKGKKLGDNIQKKETITEAKELYIERKKQKLVDGYRIVKEMNTTNDLNEALPLTVNNLNSEQNKNEEKKITKPTQEEEEEEEEEEEQQQIPNHFIKMNQGNTLPPIPQESSTRIIIDKKNMDNKNHSYDKKEDIDITTTSNYSADKRSQASSNHSKSLSSRNAHKKKKHGQHRIYRKHKINTHGGKDNISIDSHSNLSENFSTSSSCINEEGNIRNNKQYKHHTAEDEKEEKNDNNEQEQEHNNDNNNNNNKNEHHTRSSSSSGRSSDKLYQMNYEKMTKVMLEAIKHPKPNNPDWKPLKMWIRYNEEIDNGAMYYLAPMTQRIAGSCHELLVAYLKSNKGEIVTRLIKLARDPDEDNQHHFETERLVAQYLSRIALSVNRIYHSRTDVCIWPVETIYFEYNNQMKWATCQAPFLPEDNSCFVKIEPNSGRPCVHDPIVGRYQHCFAAITRGLNLVRDWQGYGVNQQVFLKQCQKYCPEACLQIRKRSNDQNVQVLVVIDPVLTTCTAHYETNNPTDFGIKALDEWLETHNCKKCRCNYFHLNESIQFGIADPGQEFFTDDTPKYLKQEILLCRKDLNIWDGDDFQPPQFESKTQEQQ